jgi:hypothetical protein
MSAISSDCGAHEALQTIVTTVFLDSRFVRVLDRQVFSVPLYSWANLIDRRISPI